MSVQAVHMIVAERVEMVVVEVARIHVRIFVLVARVVVEDVRDVQAVQVAQLLADIFVKQRVGHVLLVQVIVEDPVV